MSNRASHPLLFLFGVHISFLDSACDAPVGRKVSPLSAKELMTALTHERIGSGLQLNSFQYLNEKGPFSKPNAYKLYITGKRHCSNQPSRIFRWRSSSCFSGMTASLTACVLATFAQPRHRRHIGLIPRPIAQRIHNPYTRNAHHWIGEIL